MLPVPGTVNSIRHMQYSPPDPELAWNSCLHHVDTGPDCAREPSSRVSLCQPWRDNTLLITAVAEEV